MPARLSLGYAQLALQSAHALEAQGHPHLALESLQVAVSLLGSKSTGHDTVGEEGDHSLNPCKLQPMYTRLLASCASVGGCTLPVALPPHGLKASHSNDVYGVDAHNLQEQQQSQQQQSQQQLQQQHQTRQMAAVAQDLISHVSHTQHHVLGHHQGTAHLADLTDQLAAVLDVLESCHASMIPSGSRALLPALPLSPSPAPSRSKNNSADGTSVSGSMRE